MKARSHLINRIKPYYEGSSEDEWSFLQSYLFGSFSYFLESYSNAGHNFKEEQAGGLQEGVDQDGQLREDHGEQQGVG